ncbi:ImmA/IrrE family metallo-endopeptidase [Glutamicibacter mishrai]|uniref:ImmA/IrrE family metallo-endopeptidase n=1 Tax=Glutamicibacter mishrai TaxID=1775880 RepID=UPI0020CB8FF1|nr:ImmA/IrrE family metallo-endopeptidase [Glutamicibacter mishrai]UTT41334.1 ImmA/IrrE family metallo-endopeptidase [Glutamicibacter mishrai]UTT41336.1 ImmA/IrrE family metallo-endopeptidase [Glutamicibacter mishrai]
MFDPWAIIGANPWIEIHHVRMPEGKPGATDGQRIIWLDERLTARERRCVLTHELIHLQYEHSECQAPKVERRVRTETSHLLIPWPELAKVQIADLSSLAEELNVTVQVLEDRLFALSPLEVDLLRERGVTISSDVSW